MYSSHHSALALNLSELLNFMLWWCVGRWNADVDDGNKTSSIALIGSGKSGTSPHVTQPLFSPPWAFVSMRSLVQPYPVLCDPYPT